jgi:hypothetical protein
MLRATRATNAAMELRLDVSEFEARAKALDAAEDQIPFALSLALNSAVQDARGVLIQDTWPKHVMERNPGFIRWALGMNFSTKQNLRVEIHDERAETRAHLQLHRRGGAKVANKRLAIPPKGSVVRTAHGVMKSQRPYAIITNTPRRALRITEHGIFVGQGGRLHLRYLFYRLVQQPADVPFDDVFAVVMLKEVRESFPAALARAMSTRR